MERSTRDELTLAEFFAGVTLEIGEDWEHQQDWEGVPGSSSNVSLDTPVESVVEVSANFDSRSERSWRAPFVACWRGLWRLFPRRGSIR